MAAAVTVLLFVSLSDLYWYIDHSCEEYKTSSVPAPDLPSIPCSGSVQPEHRWQCHYAGNAVGSGEDCRATQVQERWPSKIGHTVFKGAQAPPQESLPPPVYHESTALQGPAMTFTNHSWIWRTKVSKAAGLTFFLFLGLWSTWKKQPTKTQMKKLFFPLITFITPRNGRDSSGTLRGHRGAIDVLCRRPPRPPPPPSSFLLYSFRWEGQTLLFSSLAC